MFMRRFPASRIVLHEGITQVFLYRYYPGITLGIPRLCRTLSSQTSDKSEISLDNKLPYLFSQRYVTDESIQINSIGIRPLARDFG
jgi:hypothetical protein